MSVYALTSNILALREVLGDLNADELPEDIVAKLVLAENDTIKAVEDVAKLIKNSEYQEAAFRTESNVLRFQAHRESIIQQRLKDQLKGLLKALDVDHIDTNLFEVSVRNSPHPAVFVPNEAEVDLHEFPKEFVKVEMSINKSALRDAIETGNTNIPEGVELRRGTYLHLRTVRSSI